MTRTVFLRLQWNGESPLHSGYSSDFAKLAEDIGDAKKSVNLKTRQDVEGKVVAAFLVSSAKGVFRNASAWLVEKVTQEYSGRAGFITCDYLGDKAWEKFASRPECPVCRVYGGSGCRVGEKYRNKSKVTFSFAVWRGNQAEVARSDAIHPQVTTVGYHFAHEPITGKSEPELEIEALQVDNGHFWLDLRIDHAEDLSIAMVCLAADLISSGFFRFGRFTSRGYGIVKLIPEGYFAPQSLSDLLATGSMNWQKVEATCGYEMARHVLGQDPIGIVKETVRSYIEQ